MSRLYLSKEMLIILGLGFASGLPLRLSASTLHAWLFDLGISIAAIGALNLVRLPYTLKFIWAPLLDRYSPPLLKGRRGWIFTFQLLLCGAIVLAAVTDPAQDLSRAVAIAAIIAFLSASQDITIDAYRTELLEPSRFGAGAAMNIFGYRMGMLYSGALALVLADVMSWRAVYLIMAVGMACGAVVTLMGVETEVGVNKPRSLKDAVVLPLADFLKRSCALEILLFIVLFKLGDVVAGSITVPFYLDLGFSKAEVGVIDKWIGMGAVILGGIVGGKILSERSLLFSLTIFSLLQMVGTLLFAALASLGHSYWGLVGAIVGENLFAGMGTTGQVALLMRLCNRSFTATQYALLSSVAALSGVFAASVSGLGATQLGWPGFFLLCTLAGLPGLLLLRLRWRAWGIEEFKA